MSRSLVGLCALSIVTSSASVLAQEATPPAPPSNSSAIPPRPGTLAENPAPDFAAEPEITLEELLRLALANNPQPRIAAATLEAAKERAGALKSLPNPVLLAAPGFTGNYNARNEELILSQQLDLFGQRKAQRSALEAEARQAQSQADLTSRTLTIAVKNAAAELFAAQEAESLGVSQVAIARAFRDAAARKADLGDAPAVQAQRAGVELERAQSDLDRARAERLAQRAALNQIIGNPPETPLRVTLPESTILSDLTGATSRPGILPGAVPYTGTSTIGASGTAPSSTTPGSPVAPPAIPVNPLLGSSSQVGSDLIVSRTQLLPQALDTRPDVVGAQAALDARRAAALAITRSRYPQIELQVRRDGVINSATGTSLRAVVTVPIFDFGSIKRQKRAAQADVRAQEDQLLLLKSQIAAQVESALVRLSQQRTTVERYRTSIVPQTLDLLRKTQIGYAAGASTYLEVLEAQRATRQVQTEYLQALVGVRISEAALESAFGANLPDQSMTSPAATPTTNTSLPIPNPSPTPDHGGSPR